MLGDTSYKKKCTHFFQVVFFKDIQGCTMIVILFPLLLFLLSLFYYVFHNKSCSCDNAVIFTFGEKLLLDLEQCLKYHTQYLPKNKTKPNKKQATEECISLFLSV